MTNLIIKQQLQNSAEHFALIRRDIHSFPELGADTLRTAALVAEMLGGWGYEVHTGVGGNGVVGVLRRGNGKRSLGIRADMDALPILEKNGLPWASQHQGRMHACGHDGHTTTLLAAAEQLAHTAEFDGTLNLIFQPDEEGLAGAKLMIEDDLFDRFPCDAVYAYHNMPGLPVGQAVVQVGGLMASSERVTITLTGRGGHGAMP
ncbi:amidohydrolase, partial [Pseudomonas sp. Ant30-3]|uniref:amidohydrolase n=1 Tax=Pseudomonas sp. Ant30-3 TaxID=1488328 RepID=UPI0005185A93